MFTLLVVQVVHLLLPLAVYTNASCISVTHQVNLISPYCSCSVYVISTSNHFNTVSGTEGQMNQKSPCRLMALVGSYLI